MHYTWKRGDALSAVSDTIPGATGAVYATADGDKGKFVTVTVTRANTSGSVTASTRQIAHITVDSPAAIQEWLADQPSNTPDTPYRVALDVPNLAALSAGDPAMANLFASLGGKYVSLDLSGCDGTMIGEARCSSIPPDPNKSFLVAVTLPERLTNIGAGAFYACENLETVILPESLTTIGMSAFGGCTSLETISLPENLTAIGSAAFRNCASLKSISLPEGLTSLGGQSFQDCTSLESVSLPAGLTSLGNTTFNGCTSLKTISLPAGITNLSTETFSGCTSLESISLPAGLLYIGSKAFKDCTSLESISLPAGLIAVNGDAFYNCTSLESISLPAGVTTIGSYAFTSCISLAAVICNATVPPTLGNQAFLNTPAGLVIKIPAGASPPTEPPPVGLPTQTR